MNPAKYLLSRRRLNVVLILSLMVVIFLGSATPQKDIPPAVSSIAKVLHLLEYALLGFLVLPFVYTEGRPLSIAVIFTTVYAASDEFHQLFVPGRHGSPYDVLIDSFGSLIGAYFAKRWNK
jgi:VanZ family protein